MATLTAQQLRFFDDFGFLVFPGLLEADIGWITSEFEKVFTDKGIDHDETKRSCYVPFIDQSVKLSALLDHPAILGIASSLLGDDFNYIGGDGNYYTGETSWHPDGARERGRYIKIAFYLDPVTRDTGALRVIPGSQKQAAWDMRAACTSEQWYGMAGRDVPSHALESNPGDVVVFNHNLMHASYGGSTRRRMFTINLCEHARNQPEIEELRDFVGGSARFWLDEPFSRAMVANAGPERLRHLQQVMDNADHLPALAAKARQTMTEPARG